MVHDNMSSLHDALGWLAKDDPVDITAALGRDPSKGEVMVRLHHGEVEGVAVADTTFGADGEPDTRILTILPRTSRRYIDWEIRHEEKRDDAWRVIRSTAVPLTEPERGDHFVAARQMAVRGLNQLLADREARTQ